MPWSEKVQAREAKRNVEGTRLGPDRSLKRELAACGSKVWPKGTRMHQCTRPAVLEWRRAEHSGKQQARDHPSSLG